MRSVLQSAKKDIVETAKAQMMKSQMEGVRKAVLAHVAEKYTEEVEYNISRYIETLGKANVEVEFKGKPGEALVMKAEHAISELEGYIEKQNPDGAVIQFLKRRYKEEGVRIITGRLYGGHYVNRAGQGVYEVLNRMGYAADVDRRKPWLTGRTTTEGLENLFADAAVEIFELVFEDANLSDDAALLKFTGVSEDVDKSPDAAQKRGSGSKGRKKKR
ncbi:MAG: hypothetical protein ACO39X_05930 [Candidatus Nanopelagicaceae bacterium]